MTNHSVVQSYSEIVTEADEETGTEEYTTVTENHFGTSYTSVVKEKSVSYSVGSATVEYSYNTDDDERISSDSIKHNGNSIIPSSYSYDDNNNCTSKVCSFIQNGEEQPVDFVYEYDSTGRLTGFGIEDISQYYEYDANSQIKRVDCFTHEFYTSLHTYDDRGNILSRKEYDYTRGSLENRTPLSTTTFTYSNTEWEDQLIAVNNIPLTYDENGNVLTYGNRSYTWENGRNLADITEGENSYSYTYDESGIRTSKTVNGTTTYYNTKDGVILSQTDGTNTMYFQYDTSGVPLGFIYNGTQYFYITSQTGDIIAITEADGEAVAQYAYDEWGKLLGIGTFDDDNPEQLAVAEANPLRYRGYYYDNETGYYYLQSRYYDPSICRFINADLPEYVQSLKNNTTGIDMFAYCNNSPINDTDHFGLFPSQLFSNIITFTVNISPLQPDKKRYLFWRINIVKSSYAYLKQISGEMYCSSCSFLYPKNYATCPISFTSRGVCYATGGSCHHFSTSAKGTKVIVGWSNVWVRLVARTFYLGSVSSVVTLR